MSYTAFTVSINNGVAHVILSRPDMFNAMDGAFWGEIKTIFEDLPNNPEVRAIVLSSTGKHFSAGMELGYFGSAVAQMPQGEPGRQREQVRRMVLEFQSLFNAIDACRVPVLAALQGGCIGGAVDLACACDMRYCTSDAFFTIQEIKIGMTADLGTLQRLPALMPPSLARELAYTGRKLLADEARSSGYVTRVFDDHQAMIDGVLGIANDIAQRSPLAVTGSKEMLNYARDHSVADGLNYIATWNAAMVITQDLEEGMKAQAEKRAPQYSNLMPRRPID